MWASFKCVFVSEHLSWVSYPWHLFHTQMSFFHTWCNMFHTILVYFKTYGMQLVWLSTAIVFFHTLGALFHTQMTFFHTWCNELTVYDSTMHEELGGRKRRSTGGRGGGWRLRLVAVSGRGAADRSIRISGARARGPGSLAGLPRFFRSRYEKCAQGMKQVHKGMKNVPKVWNKSTKVWK